MRWDLLVIIAAVVVCVACLLVHTPIIPGSLFGIRASLPEYGTVRRHIPDVMRPWPLQMPTDLQLPEPIGEPFEPSFKPSFEPSKPTSFVYPRTDVSNVLPWSADLNVGPSTWNKFSSAVGTSLYGDASPAPLYGMMRDNTADSLLPDPSTQYPDASLPPLAPIMTPITLRPLD